MEFSLTPLTKPCVPGMRLHPWGRVVRAHFSNSLVQRGYIFLTCTDSLLMAALSIVPCILCPMNSYLPYKTGLKFLTSTVKSVLPLVLQKERLCVLSRHLTLCMLLWWQLSQWIVIMWKTVEPHGWQISLACVYQWKTKWYFFNLRMPLKNTRMTSSNSLFISGYQTTGSAAMSGWAEPAEVTYNPNLGDLKQPSFIYLSPCMFIMEPR